MRFHPVCWWKRSMDCCYQLINRPEHLVHWRLKGPVDEDFTLNACDGSLLRLLRLLHCLGIFCVELASGRRWRWRWRRSRLWLRPLLLLCLLLGMPLLPLLLLCLLLCFVLCLLLCLLLLPLLLLLLPLLLLSFPQLLLLPPLRLFRCSLALLLLFHSALVLSRLLFCKSLPPANIFLSLKLLLPPSVFSLCLQPFPLCLSCSSCRSCLLPTFFL
mmetsp:Transcript_11942/g.24857  ORF Transcript_11942/g.24857 Transcript_11942/m.24857 type:complete len:215 (-) Transcript_11942:1413-2057(-)